MRHGNYKYKLGVKPAHRKALLKNLAVELIEHGQIKTTITKCKALRPFVEKLVTIARNDSIANRRLAFSKLNNASAVRILFGEVAPKYKERAGGYTRILRFADSRVGDASKMGLISFLN